VLGSGQIDRTVSEANAHFPVPLSSAIWTQCPSRSSSLRWSNSPWDGSIFANMEAEEIIIRRTRPNENSSVHALVQAIADETFAYIFASSEVPIGEPNWMSAWVAVLGEEIVGVTLTQDEWVSDLWVRSESRGFGIGAKLLAQAESEIRSRGHQTFRLRVVKSNIRAVQFYESQGWKIHHEIPHEKFGHSMFEMNKSDRQI
jgi:ribosomal protein S18 acetylase RimI-like enzyme